LSVNTLNKKKTANRFLVTAVCVWRGAHVSVAMATAPSFQTMKFFLCLSVAVLAVAVFAAEDKKDAASPERPKTFRRLIPADVLRGTYSEHRSPQGDFPLELINPFHVTYEALSRLVGLRFVSKEIVEEACPAMS
jgi:hypothetical protein